MKELVVRGMKRRRKDIVYVVLVSFIATFFMSGVLMFQSILDSYVTEKNRDTYGDWVIAARTSAVSHAYLTEKGSVSTSVNIRREDGTLLPKCVGSVSEELMSFGRIHLYEGRMPKNSSEIVSDLQTLQTLGYSYDLGQTITIYYDAAETGKDQDLRGKNYTLVGTMKPFNQLWVQGEGLRYPDVVVTEEELQSFGKEIRTSWFWRLDPDLPDIDVQEFADSLQQSMPEDHLVFNSYVYANSIWGSEGGYSLVIGMMIVVSVVSISFVLSAYTEKRRAAYYRLRMIGSSRMELNRIILLECGLPTVVPAVFAIGLAYLIGAAVCGRIAKSVGLQGFFGFELPVFLLQIASVFGTIVLGILISMYRTSDRRLSQESKTLSRKEIARIRRVLPKLVTPERELFKRQRILHPAVQTASALFIAAVTAFMMICLGNVISAVQKYMEQQEEPDYTISVRNPEQIVWEPLFVESDGSVRRKEDAGLVSAGRDYFNPYYGPSDQELSYLGSIDGIREVQGLVFDDWHMVRWEGYQNSPRFRAGGTTSWLNPVFAGINIVSDREFLKAYFKDHGESFPESDYEAFERGELCFLLGNTVTITTDFTTGETTQVIDKTLQDNDLLTIYSETNEEGLQIPVRIVENDAFLWKYYYSVNRTGLPVFISETTAEALRHLETPLPEFRENKFLFRFDSLSSFEGTDKVLAAFSAGYANSEYFNNAESKRHMLREQILRPLLIFGSLFLMSLAVFFIVLHNFAEIRSIRNQESLQRFRRIGVRGSAVRKSLFLSEAFESVPVLFGLIAGLIWKAFSRLYYNKKTLGGVHETRSFCSLTKTWTDNPYLMTADELLSLNTLITAFAVLLLFAVLTFFSFTVSRRRYESEGIL